MVLNDLVDSPCYSQKNAGLKGLTEVFGVSLDIRVVDWVFVSTCSAQELLMSVYTEERVHAGHAAGRLERHLGRGFPQHPRCHQRERHHASCQSETERIWTGADAEERQDTSWHYPRNRPSVVDLNATSPDTPLAHLGNLHHSNCHFSMHVHCTLYIYHPKNIQ